MASRPRRSPQHLAQAISNTPSSSHRGAVVAAKAVCGAAPSERGVWALVLCVRLINALTVQTYLVPDETWQSLEVAHNLVFGTGYLTWEWRHELRSYAHPWLFAQVYRALQAMATTTGCSNLVTDAQWLIHAPYLVCGVTAAVIDIFTYKLSRRYFGQRVARWTLFASMLSWTMGTLMVRPLANAVETAFIAVALFYWPLPPVPHIPSQPSAPAFAGALARALGWAALGCVLRPTSAVLWLMAGGQLLVAHPAKWLTISLVVASVGAAALGLLLAVDRHFYKKWVFVPYQFYHFNVSRNLSIWFGDQPWYWYVVAGVPSLLTVFLPFMGYGAWIVLATPSPQARAFRPMIWTAVGVLVGYSLLAHKEARFLACLLPILFALTGVGLDRYFNASPDSYLAALATLRCHSHAKHKQRLVLGLIVASVPAVLYTNLVHQRGVVDVTEYLHIELRRSANSASTMHVLFLMPCHSTPLHSHIHHRTALLSFLPCEPPVASELSAKEYICDSDEFSQDPRAFFQSYLHRVHQVTHSSHGSPDQHLAPIDATGSLHYSSLPDILVLFEAVLAPLDALLRANKYQELCMGDTTVSRLAVATEPIDDDYAIINQNAQTLLSLVPAHNVGSQLGASRKAVTHHQHATLSDDEALPASYSLKLHKPTPHDDTSAIFTRHIIKNRLRRYFTRLLFDSSAANQDQQSMAFQSLQRLERLER
ncbi:glycosylphosphatidylinositol anchor biosynthesis [Dimargaris verticillata]|uniref:Mannosyltransferase n=1 Tax=Dimargaris verticillata TaxID=2761393 RepID=A0A9W8B653_9FUNG|nr:glycosylphosphatidylinositol anchor biosynthesis [Dimargaris verticillata]